MKKLIVVFALAIFAFMIVLLNRPSRVKIGEIDKGCVRFSYGDTKVFESIFEDDLACFADIFEGKRLYKDNPSCGFSENISVELNDNQLFCIAMDTCPIIYWKNKNRYFKISESEQYKLYEVLKKYGFFFPCI